MHRDLNTFFCCHVETFLFVVRPLDWSWFHSHKVCLFLFIRSEVGGPVHFRTCTFKPDRIGGLIQLDFFWSHKRNGFFFCVIKESKVDERSDTEAAAVFGAGMTGGGGSRCVVVCV